MSLTKRDIAKNISLSSTLTLLESSKILDKFIQKIIVSSKKSNLKLSNFGTFSYKFTPKRIGRNPKTKEEYIIKDREKLSFSSSKKIKELIN
jgi:integration host factor subunit alpha